MRIRRWPFVIGTTVLFGGVAVGCGSQSQSQPFVSASEQSEELTEAAIEETSTDAEGLVSDTAAQEAADASGEDDSTPVDADGEDNAEEGGEMATEEGGEMTTEEGGEITFEEGGETTEEGSEMTTEEGGETAEEGGETTEAGGEMATEEGGEGGSEELPKIGDKCDGDPFGGEAGVCAGDPPEPVLICSGGVYEDAANFSDLCSCEDMDGDGKADEVVCLSPGFVGIQRSGRKRVATRRLRRV